MKSIGTYLTVVLLVWLTIDQVQAQVKGRNPGHLEYERYTRTEGLAGRMPGEMLQDSLGFIWIATYDGLLRFDGYQFKLFRPEPDSLYKNRVEHLFLNKQGKIYACSASEIRLFDPRTQQFNFIDYPIPFPKSPSEIQDLVEDDFGNIWVATNGQGLKIIPANQSIRTRYAIKSIVGSGFRRNLSKIINSIPDEYKVFSSNSFFGQNSSKSFIVEDTTTYLIMFLGEYSKRGKWVEFGWLTNKTLDTLWSPDYSRSMHAESIYNDRIIFDSIKLVPGTYKLNFKSEIEQYSSNFRHIKRPKAKRRGITLCRPGNLYKKRSFNRTLQKLQQFRQAGRWISSDFVHALHVDKEGRIFVGTKRGLEIFSQTPYGSKIENSPYPYLKHITFKKKENGSIYSQQVLNVESTNDQQILLTGYNPMFSELTSLTLEVFDPSSQNFRQIPTGVSRIAKAVYILTNHHLNSAVLSQDGNLWLSGSHNGLYRIPRAFYNFPSQSQLPSDTFLYQFSTEPRGFVIRDIIIDRNRNIWLSTSEDSMYKLSSTSIQSEFLEPPKVIQEKIKTYRALFTDKDQDIWMTSWDGQGLYKYLNDKELFEKVEVKQLNTPEVTFQDLEGNIWINSSNGAVGRYNKDTGELKIYQITAGDFVKCHLQNEDGRIWISDYQSNLGLLNVENGQFETIPTYKGFDPAGGWGGLSYFKQFSQDTFWLGYHLGRLGRLVRNANNRYSYSEFLMQKRIVGCTQDNRGRLWLGTQSEGLFLFDGKQGIVKTFDDLNGLIHNRIRGLYADNQNRLWINTSNGIQILNIETDQFLSMSLATSLGPLGAGAAFLDAQNSLYISKGSGIHILRLDSIKIDSIPPSMVLTNLTIDIPKEDIDTLNLTERDITYTDHITLGYVENTIAISYAGVHYNNPKEHLYAHRMVGLNDNWQEVGKERVARYNKLPPGKYIFEVKASNADGVWTDNPASLQITILPPWYWNSLSKTLYGLLGIGIILFGYQFELNRRLTQAEALRVSELNQAKTRLYTNITHEFRTPLTVISGMANQVLEDPKKWFSEGLHMIKRNSRQLLQLVNQLLDLAKLESGEMKVKAIQDDIVPFIKYLGESFQSAAKVKEQQLHLLLNNKAIHMDFDPDKIQSIVSNLLSNAIKFTPANGTIFLMVDQLESKDDKLCQIKVSDSGPGISAVKLPHIFDRFYQVDGSSTRGGEGTGIGLSLTKELVELLGGNIRVESLEEEGTTFIVELPITNTAPERSIKADLDTAFTVKAPLLSNLQALTDSDDKTEKQQILLVEDNADVLQYLSSCLSEQYRLEFALNGQQGIDKAMEQIPDIIISDVMMPEKDGFELLQILKQDERTNHIPIILLTAKADIESKLQGLSHGADAYLAKPFHPGELLIRIQNLIKIRTNLQLRYQKSRTNEIDSTTINKPIMKEDAFLMKVRRSVERNMADEKFGIPELCQSLAISRTQLHRKLKAVTGQSTSFVVRSIRLERAKKLLETTDLNVSEVGYAVGYANSSHFTQDFRKEFGKPPREYKKS